MYISLDDQNKKQVIKMRLRMRAAGSDMDVPRSRIHFFIWPVFAKIWKTLQKP